MIVYTIYTRNMGRHMRNITFSADEHLIEAARAQARARNTTLNEEFRRWLENYTQREERMRRYEETTKALRGKLVVGRRLTREERNER